MKQKNRPSAVFFRNIPGVQYMEHIRHHKWIWFALAAVAALAVLAAQQLITLRKAHGSFDDYAAFRGCETVTGRTATSGTCMLASGRSITIIEVNGRWYLDGDTPPRCFWGPCL